MKNPVLRKRSCFRIAFVSLMLALLPHQVFSAEKLIGIHSVQSISQSMPWIAQEARLFQKYNLDFQLIYIGASPLATAVMLGGDAEIAVGGGAAFVRAYVQGAADFVFIGGVKNILTHGILAGPEIKRVEDLKGKKIGVTRIGSTGHYFTVQAVRRAGLDPVRDVTFIQAGREADALVALASGSVDAATLSPPINTMATAQGFRYVVYGPDIRIPYAATAFGIRRSMIAKRPKVVAQYMRVMAEAAKIMHTDREFTYKVLGKHLRLTDRGILDAAYNAEIKSLEPRLHIQTESVQAMLEEISLSDPRAKKVKAQELIDRRYIDDLEHSGFFDQLWSAKK